MKKVTKILALSLALIMSIMMFASCALFQAKPAKDPEDAKKALEDNDYTVTLTEDVGDYEAMLVAYNKDGERISIAWYKEADDAKEAYNDLKEAMKEAEDELKELKDELGDDEYKEAKELLDNTVYGKSGNMVWSGTKQAVKDAK